MCGIFFLPVCHPAKDDVTKQRADVEEGGGSRDPPAIVADQV